jgi:hypothetical protein
VEETRETGTSKIVEPPQEVELPSGQSLDPVAVEAFLRKSPARFVTILGDRDSGKTTLICSIYDRFLRGPFAGCLFAGSRSLFDLERWSHPSREASGGVVPETAHTSLDEGLRFFHLAVAKTADPKQRSDLMFSDRAGEFYRSVRNVPERAQELDEVRAADTLVLLLDGKRLAQADEREQALSSVRQIIRLFVDADVLQHRPALQIVTTKLDLVEKSAERSLIAGRTAELKARLSQDYEAKFSKLSFHAISARDPANTLPPAHNVDTLFAEWVEQQSEVALPGHVPDLPLSSQFDRLLNRIRWETA